MRYLPVTDEQLKEAMKEVCLGSDYKARVDSNPLAYDQTCVHTVMHAHSITEAEAMKKLDWLKRGPFRVTADEYEGVRRWDCEAVPEFWLEHHLEANVLKGRTGGYRADLLLVPRRNMIVDRANPSFCLWW